MAKKEFLEVERLYARSWRIALQNLKLPEVAKFFQALRFDSNSCNNLKEASDLARAAVNTSDIQSGIMPLALRLLNVPQQLHHDIRNGWRKAGYPSLTEYAPYAAFVLTIELFFYIALAASLISNERASNRVDIAYLFYLPFCMMFVSNDRLHQSCAPLFLRDNQEFVWGQDLKKSLGKINEHYLQLPESDKEKGVISFASDLPQIDDSFIEHLWTRLLPKYQKKKEGDTADGSLANPPTIEEIKGMEDLSPLSPEEIDFDPVNVDQVLIKRSVSRVRGSWRQIPD